MATPANCEAKNRLSNMDWLIYFSSKPSELGGQGSDTAQQADTRTEEDSTGRKCQRKRGRDLAALPYCRCET